MSGLPKKGFSVIHCWRSWTREAEGFLQWPPGLIKKILLIQTLFSILVVCVISVASLHNWRTQPWPISIREYSLQLNRIQLLHKFSRESCAWNNILAFFARKYAGVFVRFMFTAISAGTPPPPPPSGWVGFQAHLYTNAYSSIKVQLAKSHAPDTTRSIVFL